MLKILSWNVNGMGKESKRRWVKNAGQENKISFLCLQESKMVIQQDWQVASVWGGPQFQFAAIDPVGHSSGLITIWNDSLFQAQCVEKKEGFIAVMGSWLASKLTMGVINVYAPQDSKRKRLLWTELLGTLKKYSGVAWVICGDFNEVRTADERKGSNFDPMGEKFFNDLITSAGLSDIPLGGRKYTWMNRECSKLSKLDRFLRLSRKLRYLKRCIKEWRERASRDIKADCELLKLKIAAIDFLAESSSIDMSIVNERANLLVKLNDLVANQVSDLKQKAKSRWTAMGDENTSFFHGLLNSRRKSSRIHGLNINDDVFSGNGRGKKLNRVAWERVLSDKKSGGLGIGSLRALNLAMLAKCWWRERTQVQATWNAAVSLCNSLQFVSRNSRSRRTVWSNIKSIETDLGDIGININSLMINTPDRSGWSWLLEANNIFSVRSLRRLIDCVMLPSMEQETEWLKWIPSKANIHLWRTLNNRLATRDNLVKRGVTCSSDECSMCLVTMENLDHVFATCSTTKVINAHMASWVNWWPATENSVRDMWSVVCEYGDSCRREVGKDAIDDGHEDIMDDNKQFNDDNTMSSRSGEKRANIEIDAIRVMDTKAARSEHLILI
ncbi:Endonuclease/exonuclease/phosphatase, partial [Cynara cardunculus var. scolymus]